MTKPLVWDLADLLNAELGKAALWATPSVRKLAASRLPYTLLDPFSPSTCEMDSLVVIGGGTLIDAAKVWRHKHAPGIKLIAIPSIWGSGAEASPIAVVNHGNQKTIRVDKSYLPHARVIWPELAHSIPLDKARAGCGDCWAHALEAFLSPLTSEELRIQLAELMIAMLALPLANDPRWFEISAIACACQAQAGVGLIHGIAHTLEIPLSKAQPELGWGHAKLCAIFLWPVMSLNRNASGKCDTLFQLHHLPDDAIMSAVQSLFEAAYYRQALPHLAAHWQTILRDPCTRTNGLLVRPQHLAHFETFPTA